MILTNPTLDALICGMILTAMGMCWVVLLVRINGLRSFSKMTNFDFVMTVAVGSLLAGAGQATSWTSLLQTLAAMAALFGVQYLSARLRQASDKIESLMQNQPIILMRDGVINEKALALTRVAKSDLIAKLREANVMQFDQVRAVVLETTGDISVVHGQGSCEQVIEGVRTTS